MWTISRTSWSGNIILSHGNISIKIISGKKGSQWSTSQCRKSKNYPVKISATFCFSEIPIFLSREAELTSFYCNESFQYYPSNADFKDLRSTIIANCIFDSFLTHTAIMLNIETIYAIHKAATIAKPLKTLLLHLAFLTRELRACARARYRYDVGNGIRSLARLVDSCKLFLDFRPLSAF